MVSIYWEIWAFKELQKALSFYDIKISNLKEYNLMYERVKSQLKNTDILAEDLLQNEVKEIENKYDELLNNLKKLEEKSAHRNKFTTFWNWVKIYLIKHKLSRSLNRALKIENHETQIIKKNKLKLEKEFLKNKSILDWQTNNYQWAIAELEVQRHLEKISINSFLINDFYQIFNDSIAMKWWNDWIKTIQIDHILINNKWLFLIETKNWSKKFESKESFTPVYQCQRHWHAFYFWIQTLLEKKIWKKIRRFDIVARKQKTYNNYHKSSHVYEMNIHSLSSFICTKPDILSNQEVQILLEELT